jgi:hypothetical protein
MRSRTSHIISSSQVQQWALTWLCEAVRLKDRGRKCTAAVVWSIVLRAAAQMISVSAACRDLCHAPSDEAVFTALQAGLPKTLRALENQLHAALTANLPTRVRKRAWPVAIDWQLVPYYGEPLASRNELYRSKPSLGTTKFHAYATACIVSRGVRYTLAATWVRRHESKVTVLRRLLARLRELGLKIRRLLLDAAFYSLPVTALLQSQRIPFLMPAVIRGRRPQPGTRATGLRAIRRQRAGWYPHLLVHKQQRVRLSICVAYRSYKHHTDGRQKSRKLLFAAWGVSGRPTEIRELYRQRFGIESSYRQRRQARITTCTRNPHLRLVFFVVALLLRNLWVWIHEQLLSAGPVDDLQVHLERLRFRRMLDWLRWEIVAAYHDGSPPCVGIAE